MNAPSEILQIWINNGVKKAGLPVWKMILLGMAAGCYIGFGGAAFVLVTAACSTPFEVMAGKLIGAAVFPAGLMMVAFCGAELFTGNALMMTALLDRKISLGAMLKNWIVVYLANFAGSALLSLALAGSGLFTGASAEKAVAVAAAKCGATVPEMILRGILCNMLVVLALWFQTAAKSAGGKILAIWFPIMLFVLCGFEHSVANMLYVPLGMLLGAEVTMGRFLLMNLLPVTIGNIMGGAVVISGMYYFAYKE